MMHKIDRILLRHSSRGVAFDRYSTIRSFFRQQHAPPVEPISLRLSFSLNRARSCNVALRRCLSHRIAFRHYSTTPRLCSDPGAPRPAREDGSSGGGGEHSSSSGAGESDQKSEPTQDEMEPQRLDNYPRFFRRLALSLPHLHRPSRDDFLNAANGFWQRARVRFKWLTIRSFRKYNADDLSAFFTWFLMSQTLWLFVGTTTFFSVLFATANSLRLQAYLARAISDYLTSETGITIIFESAIVPKWKDSRISFKNVYVTRRPGDADTRRRQLDHDAAHKAAAGYDVSNHPSYHGTGDEEVEPSLLPDYSEEDINYSMFDLSVDSIDVTLSFARWFDGKGLVKDAVVKGVRGVLDRRMVTWDPDNPPDPASFRHISQPGDFELESLQLEDVLITATSVRYTASIFRADIHTFRKRWLFYDFLAAENVVGQFDNCLFSLHRPQSIGRTTDQDLKDGQWARMSRFRMDGVNIDHLQSMTTQEGPISWITSGKVDAVLDIKFPRDPQGNLPLNAFLGEIADAITTAASSVAAERIPGQRVLAKPPLSAPSDDEQRGAEFTDAPKVVIDIDLRFRDLKAAVPIFTNDLSYVNNALIRPIVAFMNANRTLVPIRCRVVSDLNEFDGAWTVRVTMLALVCWSTDLHCLVQMWETGLMDAIAVKVCLYVSAYVVCIHAERSYHVTQANFNRRIKAVSAWSLQMTASAILSALRTLVDPMAAHLKEIYERGFTPEGVLQIPATLYLSA
ncbi:Mitochondrial distribution and morphology protein 31, partial [Grifola frondosa]